MMVRVVRGGVCGLGRGLVSVVVVVKLTRIYKTDVKDDAEPGLFRKGWKHNKRHARFRAPFADEGVVMWDSLF